MRERIAALAAEKLARTKAEEDRRCRIFCRGYLPNKVKYS